jgi:hypothetical protein
MKESDLLAYGQAGIKWLKNIRQRLHFPLSQQLFDQRLHQMLKNPVINKILEKYNLKSDLYDLVSTI